MPPAVAAVGNALLLAFGGYTAAATAAAYFAATLIVNAAAQFAINSAVRAMQPKPPRGAGKGLTTNYADTDSPAIILYGRRRIGGLNTIPPITSGNENQDLHQLLTFTIHEVNDMLDAHFDDIVIADADIGAVSGADTDGVVGGSTKFAAKAWIRRYLGTSADNVDFILNAVSGTAFPATFRGRGVSKAAIRFRFDDKVYPGSVPQATVDIEGKRLYDPRLDTTKPGGSGSHRDNDPTTWAYAGGLGTNPALATADYLLNTVFGGSYVSAEIDWTTVMAAANACDALVNIPGALTEPRYTINGLLLANEDFTVNLETLVGSMLGRIMFMDGLWRMYAGGWQTPSFTVNQADWVGPLSIQFEGGREARFNRVRCWYVDADRNHTRGECYPRANATYQAADGAETIDLEMEQPLCDGEFEAQRKGEFILRGSRNQIIVSGTLAPRQVKIGLWETGVINFADLGWTSKTFRCVGYALQPNGSANCTFREEHEADWTDLAAGEYNQPSAVALPVSNATRPTAPASFAIANSVNGTLTYVIGESVVRPSGTRYQIVRALVSSNAAVGTIVYDGDFLRGDLPAAVGTFFYWSRAYAVYAPSSFSAYTPNTNGIGAAAGAYGTSDLLPGAATYVTMANCPASQVFSKGAGAFLGQEFGRLDFAIGSSNADVILTATFRAGRGNIFNTNNARLRFITGVSSVYELQNVPNGGDTTDPRPTALQGQAIYTANNSSYMDLTWDTTSGPNSVVIDQVSLLGEFIRR